MNTNHLLIIGFVWPEPKSSAAGTRMLQLIDCFQTLGYKVSFASTTLKTEFAFDLTTLDIQVFEIKLNSKSFDDFIKKVAPSHVMFDRFLTEEQFGWRVAEQCPKAIRILDTEDLHCLRKTRQICQKKEMKFSFEFLEQQEITKRELASLFRSDLTIMISKKEIEILVSQFQMPVEKLIYIPFLVDGIENVDFESYENREHFMTIGSFRHDPNVDSVLYLKQKIWPIIREKLPEAELHIYGSYPKQQITQLHNVKEGFLIKGWAENAIEVVSKAKVMLAPLRFGAGQKGKFLDALLSGTPAVTTLIGSEGMADNEIWCGKIGKSDMEVAEMAIQLISEKIVWESEQNKAKTILKDYFSKQKYVYLLDEKLKNINDFTPSFHQEIISYHSFRNSRFMSKWIEEKNK